MDAGLGEPALDVGAGSGPAVCESKVCKQMGSDAASLQSSGHEEAEAQYACGGLCQSCQDEKCNPLEERRPSMAAASWAVRKTP
jgi:hypothetical protein